MEEKLACLERNVNQVKEAAIAAYQPSSRETHYRDNEEDEIARLKEETRKLKAAAETRSHPRRRNTYEITRISQDLSRALNEIQRMQTRIDGFLRTYASRINLQDQPRVQACYGRPICEICGKTGHVQQHCFHRFQQSQSYCEPQTNRAVPGDELIIATYKKEATTCSQPSSDQIKQREQVEQVYYAR